MSKDNKNVTDNYFDGLFKQIIDKNEWSSQKFVVYNHEAGSGKSRETHKFLGLMIKDYDYKVLYVQKFKKDDELQCTVNRINEYAGQNVADYYCSERKKEKHQIAKFNIVCITHRLYQEICKGNNVELIKDRDILIIDEFPQILDEIVVNIEDIKALWNDFYKIGNYSGKNLAEALKEMFLRENIKNGVKYINFTNEKYDYLRELLRKIKNSYNSCNESQRKLLNKFEVLFSQGFFIESNAFRGYDGKIVPYKLKNNIILDANAEFDYRYKVCDDFVVKLQPKKFDYANTQLFHYNIKTSKGSMQKHMDKIYDKAIEKIDWKNIRKILLVTDKDSQEKLGSKLPNDYYITKKIDYFGNLIGKNTYRDFDSVALLKTPNYLYTSYILEYYFLASDPEDGEIIEFFNNEEIEKLRNSLVAGELYQAIKRINRKNSISAKYYIFSDSEDAVQIIKQQMPNVSYNKHTIYLDKRNYNSDNRPKTKLIQLIELFLELKENNIKEISKKEIRERLCLKAPNLSKLLREAELEEFALNNNINMDDARTIKFL